MTRTTSVEHIPLGPGYPAPDISAQIIRLAAGQRIVSLSHTFSTVNGQFGLSVLLVTENPPQFGDQLVSIRHLPSLPFQPLRIADEIGRIAGDQRIIAASHTFDTVNGVYGANVIVISEPWPAA